MKRSELKDLPAISLYRMENFLNVYQGSDGFNFYNLLKSINIFNSSNGSVDIIHSFLLHDSWTNISYKYYKTIDLWWFICMYNQIINPLKDVEPGTEIKILKPEYIGSVLTELKKQN
jgi:hypothetical protein